LTAERYRFDFAERSPYGHVVALAQEELRSPGLIVDLGCGYGAVAEPLQRIGFDYVGCDIDEAMLGDLRGRGLEAHAVDLRSDLLQALVGIVGKRRVAAFLLLDVIEHLADPVGFMTSLRDAAIRFDQAPLIVSVPNVAHFDVGAKLATGLWQVTQTGLLDETHLQLFSGHRLEGDFARAGWRETARRDFVLDESDQHFPVDHPALVPGTPLGGFLRRLRASADDFGWVNQFVRVFAVGELEAGVSGDSAAPFFSVLARTQGRRPANLQEALTCLAAQTFTDFEVVLLVHNADDAAHAEIGDVVASFAAPFAERVRVGPVRGGGRARPLNVGLDRARGRYVAFLDDDDLVTADWLAAFEAGAQAAPGRLVRSVATVRSVELPTRAGSKAPYVTTGPPRVLYPARFDALAHYHTNRTPICAFAVPRALVRHCRLAFSEDLPVLEDWHFLLRAASLAGVHDTEQATSVYQWWVNEGSTGREHDEAAWLATRDVVLSDLDRYPILLPPGSASRIEAIVGQEAAAAALARMERSVSWRITRPLRATKAAARTLGAGRALRRLGLRP
jgi:SAM-dependent methyltransferase